MHYPTEKVNDISNYSEISVFFNKALNFTEISVKLK